MKSLTNKRIILGITGGIAAYKSADLIRRLKDAGADVQVVMTDAAKQFITPLTMQALSGNPVHDSLLDPAAEAAMGHIELARWADLVLIAPASADFIARMANGIANDLLTTLCLATQAPIAICPAMNQAMWQNQGTQINLKTLNQRGITQIGPASGSQACGEVGLGRMSEPLEIVSACHDHFQSGFLQGLRVLITAGPTREAIDPVRYISNHSSGKMGFAVAEACVEAGAATHLVAGPVNLTTPERVRRTDVTSANDMLKAVSEQQGQFDIFIATAAVADYRPAQQVNQKIKKSAESMTIELVKNPDILATVAGWKNKPFCVGFAAETNDVIAYANDKIRKKNLDMIAANDVSRTDIGFNSDQNAVTVIWHGGHQALPINSKQHIARSLVELIAQQYRRIRQNAT